ncbi:hypothetical protein BDZ89DRAFT_824246 [Hymenopellis radicata]|nr:hypothetical protein BDZ89DRAFT_824246 [Hymenopellis radicata]
MEDSDSESQWYPLATGPNISTPATSYASPFENNIARAFHAPSQDDVQVITAGLEHSDRELLDLAAKLKALNKRHAHLLRHTTQSHAYIAPSPIRQLPTELLQLIFSEACTSYKRYEYKLPLNISWVCWKWRQIALATPSLWTNIYFGGHKWYDLFEVYLSRSADLRSQLK